MSTKYQASSSAAATVSRKEESSERTLAGKWRLVREGSDYLPGLDTIPDAPLSLKLVGLADAEFYKIERKKIIDAEEIQFHYVAKNFAVNRSYQVGILNMENVVSNDVTLGIIKNCDHDFQEFTVVRLGPKAGQYSREVYKLDPTTDIMKLQLEMTTADGTRFNLVKYLSRFDSKDHSAQTPYYNNDSSAAFINTENTLGWKLFDFWPSNILSNTRIKFIKAIKIKTQNVTTGEHLKVLETLWSASESQKDNIDYSTISRHHGGRNSEGEEVVEFLIKVIVGESSWIIAHRYREFDGLRRFLLNQNPYTNEFQQIDSKFPGKTLGLIIRKGVVEKRVEGLQEYLSYYLQNARFCRQNSIDSLCSFLQLPEHMHAVASQIAEAEATAAAAIAAARAGTPSSSGAGGEHSSSNQSATNLVKAVGKRLSIFGGSKLDVDKEKVTSTTSSRPVSEATIPVVTPPATNNNAHTPTGEARPGSTQLHTTPPPASTTSPTKQPSATTSQPATEPSVRQSVTPTTVSQKPVPLPASAHPVLSENLTPAQAKLLAHIGEGITIVKHGRQGAPKQRTLTCDDEVTSLIVQSSDSHYKKCILSEVESIRLGTDIDPATPAEAIERMKADIAGNNGAPQRGVVRKASTRMSILGGGQGADPNGVLFGTAILRRTCKYDDMSMCISLILPNRTFDIQCLNLEDLRTLYSCLTEICGKQEEH